MVELEDAFEVNVLGRRLQALADYPPVDEVRPPLIRPEVSDEDPRDRAPMISKNGRRRPSNAKHQESSNDASTKSDTVTPDDLMDAIESSTESTGRRRKRSISIDDMLEKAAQQQAEVSHKLAHPHRLHESIWHNEPGEHNNGPSCQCKPKYRIGPLHNQFEGETVSST